MSDENPAIDEDTRKLLALVACGGDASAAEQSLKAQGVVVTARELHDLMSARRKEYDHLRDQFAPQVEEEIVRQLRERALRATNLIDKAITLAEKRIDEGRDTDPGRTAASMSKVVATNIEKVLALTGRPTQITETRSALQIVRGLAAQGVIELEPSAVQELPA